MFGPNLGLLSTGMTGTGRVWVGIVGVFSGIRTLPSSPVFFDSQGGGTRLNVSDPAGTSNCGLT